MDKMDEMDIVDRMDRMNQDAGIKEPLIPKHGGYRRLKSFQIAQLVYDLTVRFCDLYISKHSRTHDQMVQAARSGVQNIAEGSQASGTSKKTELKLTNVARASLEELKLDYEDFLRQRDYRLWAKDEPLRQALVNKRCKTADEVAGWLREVHDGHGRLSGRNGQNGQPVVLTNTVEPTEPMKSTESTVSTMSTSASVQKACYAELAANSILVLIAMASSLLDRQLKALADTFTQEGGFTEKLYQTRKNYRPSS